MLGQRAEKFCTGRVAGQSFHGELSDVIVYRGIMSVAKIKSHMVDVISAESMKTVNKVAGKRPGSDIRAAYTFRQYGKEELGRKFPPACKLKKPPKKLTGPGGWMRWGGTGDVHYRSFANCMYDDQSVGDWTALRVDPKYYASYPLVINFRTSPQRTNCPWCMKHKHGSAVSYIDGCAIRFKDEQASAGFGGFNYPNSHYTPTAYFNSQPMPGRWHGQFFHSTGWRRGKHMRVRAKLSKRRSYGSHWGNFHARLNDGTQLYCAKGNIWIQAPRKLIGKIGGIAGTGIRGKDWIAGPSRSYVHPTWKKKFKYNQKVPGLTQYNGCAPRYQYPYRNSPYNGNHLNKPIVQWFNSWKCDGATLPSAFGYTKGKNEHWFNKSDRSRAPSGGMSKRPKGAKAKALHKCRPLVRNKKMHSKCIFDFLVLGKQGVKGGVKDAMQKRRMIGNKATTQTVRDVSKWRNDAVWVSNPSWGCVDALKKAKAAVKRV